jgi:predicted DNA-binding transcriptional regulator YafY
MKTTQEQIKILLKTHTMQEVATKLKISKRTLYNSLSRLGIPLVGRKGRSGRKFKIC